MGIWARSLHDVFYLYGLSLNESLTLDPESGQSNASTLAHSMRRSFIGLTGEVNINDNGTRVPLFTVYGLDTSYNQVSLINFTMADGVPASFKTIYNYPHEFLGCTKFSFPLSRPVCGYTGEECPKNFWDQYSAYVIAAGAVFAVFLIAVILLLVYLIRIRHLEQEQLRLQWQIQYMKLRKPPSMKELQQQSKRSLQSAPSTITGDSRFMETNFGNYEVYFLDKNPVLTTKHASSGLSQEDYGRFLKMRKLDQDNVNRFVGLSIDGPEYIAVWRMCSRGTLQGIYYLHGSFIGCHGRLRSGCCLVNESWQVKVSDYGTDSLIEEERQKRKREVFFTLAAEHLRDSNVSKEGDVYSFAIISSEVITRRSAWNIQERRENVDELVYMIKKGGTLPPRPDLSTEGEISSALLHLIRDCWSEKPSDRPTAETVCKLLKSTMPDKKTNLMDHMFNMLEDYTTTLELDVEERTKQLQEERRKLMFF
ncbi:hypothetical protein OESDEN_06406 [Oesophagostomum dentatum]|uniref:guanylate cyclase n=1 Tax=Oesophagostomum dentatum TaxID=61180 RepID=A0A0B1T822_OESDE|nr:hypothetical protein OESDEN_06406 [Oesophagostomum dentatum]